MTETKNPALAAVLGFLFGPFGIIYVSWIQAVIGFAIVFVALLVTAGSGVVLVPFAYGIWGYIAASKHNDNIARDQRASSDQAAAQIVFQGLAAPNAEALRPAPMMNEGGATTSQGSFCTSCGKSLRVGARFCGTCGAPQ